MKDSVLLADRIQQSDFYKTIEQANREAASMLTDTDPVWVDILPAGKIVEGLGDYTVTHSGPPIDFENMTDLHRRGMISACLLEGWAKTEDEALRLIRAGRLRILSALDTNTVGSGTGIITKSVAMFVVRDRHSGQITGTFPAEGNKYQGGFCGWGLYSPGIADNLKYMREWLFPPLRELVKRMGGMEIRPILAESLQMGDENHTRQTAADYIFQHKILPLLAELDVPGMPRRQVLDALRYIAETPRFFYCLGQGACRTATRANEGRKYSTVVSAMGGNGVEYGIKIAGLGDRWFTAPAPYIRGKYNDPAHGIQEQLPWIGDSCTVECAGMGAFAGGASPIVCALRGLDAGQAVAQSREMEKICVTKNGNYPIPNMGFDAPPCGIDMLKVVKTGITPGIHGGMIAKDGGLLGAGMARIPMACFEKALAAYVKEYGIPED